MFADLHLHSMFSDGTDTPQELLHMAKKYDLQVISITDHDTVNGIRSLNKKDLQEKLCIIPGIEISTMYDHKLLHILGYFID